MYNELWEPAVLASVIRRFVTGAFCPIVRPRSGSEATRSGHLVRLEIRQDMYRSKFYHTLGILNNHDGEERTGFPMFASDNCVE